MKKLSMSGKSIKLQVTVTNDDIAKGVRGNVSRCPIALALGDNAGTLTGYPIVGVYSLNVAVRHPINHHPVRLYTHTFLTRPLLSSSVSTTACR